MVMRKINKKSSKKTTFFFKNDLLLCAFRVIYSNTKSKGERKMTKQEIFKDSMAKLKAKEEAFYKREPERKLYDKGTITWTEYLKMAKEREEKEREKYAGSKAFELYDAGLITYDEFLDMEGK